MKNSMNFKTFVNTVEALVASKLSHLQVSTQTVLKANQQLTGIIIRDESCNAAPTFYLDNFYHDYITGLLTADEVADKICDSYVDAVISAPVNAADFCSFENARNRICFKIISAESNQDYLDTVPYRMIDDTDLAVVYYVLLEENSNGTASVQITNNLLSLYGVTEDELYKLAKENTKRLFPVKLQSLFAALAGLLDTEDVPFEVIEPDADESMFVLTNKVGLFGAASILYDDVLKQFAAKRGDSYILPSSLHDVLLIPCEGLNLEPSDLLEMVMSVNATEVQPADKLSDHVYFYSANAGFITMCK